MNQGQLVIVNEYDRPCGRLVAVVIDGGKYIYINAEDERLATYVMDVDDATPVSDFGVEVIADERCYTCNVVRPSVATYRDGSRRSWQESKPTTFRHRNLKS